MLRRNLLHAKRYPVSTAGTLVVPILLLLAFAGLFGNAMGVGLGAISHGAIDYTDYLTPAVIVIAAASGGLSTVLSVNLVLGVALRAGRGGARAGRRLAPAWPLVVREGRLAQLDVPRRPLVAGVDAVG